MTSARTDGPGGVRDLLTGKPRQNPRLACVDKSKNGPADLRGVSDQADRFRDRPDRGRERIMDRSRDPPPDRADRSRDQADRVKERMDRSRDQPDRVRERLDRSRDQPDRVPERLDRSKESDRARERRDLSRDLREGRRRRDHSPDYREPQTFEIESEELDPRVQEELEKLNSCTDEINRLEVELDEANLVFRRLLSDSTHHLKALHTRLGSCIEKARPYYEALEQMMRAQAECQQAAVQFQRAAGIHAAAKETISLAEERFLDNSGEWQFDNAWQEMLNHATIKVMDAEKQRTASEKEHLARSAAFSAAEARVKALEKKLSRHIDKSKPYFEQKTTFNKALNSEKNRVQGLQSKICQSKAQYAQSLRNLEDISESIHERRKYSKQRLEDCVESVDSLTFDLEVSSSVWSSRAGSDLTLSGTTSGRDSALGSASLLGEGSSGFFPPDDDDNDDVLAANEGAAAGGGAQQQLGRLGVSRSVSLPDQLGRLGSGGARGLAIAVASAIPPQDGGAVGLAETLLESAAATVEDLEVQSIADSMLPMKL